MDHEKKPSGIFRKAALKRLYSPEQLDKLLHVVKPKAWIALIVLCIVIIIGIVWAIFGSISTIAVGEGIYLDFTQFHHVSSPIEGEVLRLPVTVGERVKKGDRIAVIWNREAGDKTELHSLYDGLVIDVYQVKGSRVKANELIASLQIMEEGVSEDRFYCFLPAKIGDKVKKGMRANVYPWGVSRGLYGGIEGVVDKISYLPATESYFKNIYLSDAFAERLTSEAPLLPVIVRPLKPKKGEQGKYIWTSGSDPGKDAVPLGSFVSMEVIVEKRRPISYLFPFWYFKKVQSQVLNNNAD